jgi:tRNA A-37 threonylcarbamoyl transferase component Bud32
MDVLKVQKWIDIHEKDDGTNNMTYRKTFPVGTPAKAVKREVTLQKVAAKYGLSPKVIATDNKTYIEMEHLGEMTVDDEHGQNIDDIPPKILSGMWSSLYTLYHVCGIEYLDVWPRNFIEKGGRVWIIDFGDARELTYKENEEEDDYLAGILEAGTITHWNPDFK